MSDLILLLESAENQLPDAKSIRDIVDSRFASVVSLQIPSLSDACLEPDEFLSSHYQYGVDLASIGDDFRLRDVILVKTPNSGSQLNFVLLHLWNWPESTYDIDSVRVPYEGETDPRNNPEGKNPGNIWAFSEQLNDRKPGTQARLFDPKTPETVGGDHLELDGIKRLIKCHTEIEDTVHVFGSDDDINAVENVATELDRKATKLPEGPTDASRQIPVMTEELPIEESKDSDDLPSVSSEEAQSERFTEFYLCDCREGIKNLPDGIIQDVVTSPPYNIAYDPFNVPKPDPVTREVRSPLREGYEDEMPAEQYHYLLQETFSLLNEKMDPESADAFINIKNNYNGGDCRPPFWLLELVPDEWHFADLLVWRYDISYDPAKNKYKPYYEWIFRFSKGNPSFPSNHSYLQDFYIPIVKGNSDEREGLVHPAIYPKKLVKTCLDLLDHSGLVVDPFLGSGTTLAAAKEMGRPAIGFEKSQKFESDIKKRIRRASVPEL